MLKAMVLFAVLLLAGAMMWGLYFVTALADVCIRGSRMMKRERPDLSYWQILFIRPLPPTQPR